jgi:hypothetical protein
MNIDLQDKLREKYPEQFKNLSWIECDEGWHEILSRLFYIVNNHLDHKKRINEPLEFFGWSQIKEKFGGLRAYYYGGDEFIRGAVWMAESMSYITCEATGEKGKLRKRKKDEITGEIIPAWMKTFSDKEAERQGYIQ